MPSRDVCAALGGHRLPRVAGWLPLAFAVATALASCNAIQGAGANATSKAPVLKTPPPYPFTPTPASALRSCGARDFSVEESHAGVYQGDVTEFVVFVNTGGTSCRLQAPPPLIVDVQAASPEPVGQRPGPPYLPVDVAAGRALDVLIGSPSTCSAIGASRLATRLHADFDGGELSADISLDIRCGPPMLLLFQASEYVPATPSAVAVAPPKPSQTAQ